MSPIKEIASRIKRYRHRAFPKLVSKVKYFSDLEKTENLDIFLSHIQRYVGVFQVRPLFQQGSIWFIEPTPEPNLFYPDRLIWLAIRCLETFEEHLAKGIILETAETLFHELIHVDLYSRGITNSYDHDEDLIESTCIILAKKFPEIVNVFEQAFDCDLTPVKNGKHIQLRKGQYTHPSFSVRPVTFEQDLKLI